MSRSGSRLDSHSVVFVDDNPLDVGQYSETTCPQGGPGSLCVSRHPMSFWLGLTENVLVFLGLYQPAPRERVPKGVETVEGTYPKRTSDGVGSRHVLVQSGPPSFQWNGCERHPPLRRRVST